MRIFALYIVVAFLSVYAWKDWFKSLCGLILLMAVIEHEDMPKAMFGIQGVNVWNILFVVILLAWIVSRSRHEVRWDMPRHIAVLLLMYLGVIVIGFLRAVFDRSHIEDIGLGSLISEQLVNTVKWVLPGVLLFDGCRTRKQVVTAVVCLLAMYFLITTQVVLRLPPGSVLQASGELLRTRNLCSDIGYGACDMSTILAGASWGILAVLPLVHEKKYRILTFAAAGMVTYGQALTGGRSGYLAWGATGLVFCLLKWRKYLILAPLVVIVLPIVLPGAAGRMLQGFGQTNVAGQTTADDYEITSGRTLVWPHVIDKIKESPVVGYGRLAMKRTGVQEYLRQEYGDSEAMGQTHNMYLETLLDNGLLGSIPIFLLWGTMVAYSGRLFRSDNRLHSAVGGVALALMLAQVFAGIGSQHFYPEESTLGMWAAMLLSLRVYVEEMRVRTGAAGAERAWDGQLSQQQAASVCLCT